MDEGCCRAMNVGHEKYKRYVCHPIVLASKRGIGPSHIPATAGIIKGKGQVHAESKKSKVS